MEHRNDVSPASGALAQGTRVRVPPTHFASAEQTAIVRLTVLDLDPTNDAIAAALGISRRSVEKQLERIYPKFNVRSKAGAVARVLWAVAGMREGEVHHRGAEGAENGSSNTLNVKPKL